MPNMFGFVVLVFLAIIILFALFCIGLAITIKKSTKENTAKNITIYLLAVITVILIIRILLMNV